MPSQQQASRATSRALTLHAALVRLKLTDGAGTLNIHIVGADSREGSDATSTSAVFAPLCELLAGSKWTEVRLLLCGPNCFGKAGDTAVDVSVGPKLRLSYSSLAYEDCIRDASMELPHLAVAFNAGVWGYDSWRPCIECVCRDARCPMLITSYNAMEAEDDEDALRSFGVHSFLWSPEANPFGSPEAEEKQRTAPTQGAPHAQFENAAWLCIAGPIDAAKAAAHSKEQEGEAVEERQVDPQMMMDKEEALARGFGSDEEVIMPLPNWDNSSDDDDDSGGDGDDDEADGDDDDAGHAGAGAGTSGKAHGACGNAVSGTQAAAQGKRGAAAAAATTPRAPAVAPPPTPEYVERVLYGDPAHAHSRRKMASCDSLRWLCDTKRSLKGRPQPKRVAIGGLSPERFEALQATPLLITGVPQHEGWPAATAWSSEEAFAQSPLGRRLELPITELFALHGYGKPQRLSLPLSVYREYAATNTVDFPYYPWERSFDSPASRDLLNQWWAPSVLSTDWDVFAHSKVARQAFPYSCHRFVIIGGARTGAVAHQDPKCSAAWNTCLVGTKRWLFLPPSVTAQQLQAAVAGTLKAPGSDDAAGRGGAASSSAATSSSAAAPSSREEEDSSGHGQDAKGQGAKGQDANGQDAKGQGGQEAKGQGGKGEDAKNEDGEHDGDGEGQHGEEEEEEEGDGEEDYRRVPPSYWWADAYPNLLASGLPMLEVVQRAGDTVYVPPLWWHAVLNVPQKPDEGLTVCVTQNLLTPSMLLDERVVATWPTLRASIGPEEAYNFAREMHARRPDLLARLLAQCTPGGEEAAELQSIIDGAAEAMDAEGEEASVEGLDGGDAQGGAPAMHAALAGKPRAFADEVRRRAGAARAQRDAIAAAAAHGTSPPAASSSPGAVVPTPTPKPMPPVERMEVTAVSVADFRRTFVHKGCPAILSGLADVLATPSAAEPIPSADAEGATPAHANGTTRGLNPNAPTFAPPANVAYLSAMGMPTMGMTMGMVRAAALAAPRDAAQLVAKRLALGPRCGGLDREGWLDWLEATCGNKRVDVLRGGGASDEQPACAASASTSSATSSGGSGTTSSVMLLADLIAKLRAGTADGMYLYDLSLSKRLPDVLHHLRVPRHFAHCHLKRTRHAHAFSKAWPTLFLGARGTRSTLHLDQWHGHFWMYCLFGCKRWTLFHPDDIALLYPDWSHGGLHPKFPSLYELQAQPGKYPLFARARRREVIVHAGEVLFVPGGTPHAVENLTDALAVAGNFVDESNLESVLADMRCMGEVDPALKEAAEALAEMEHDDPEHEGLKNLEAYLPATELVMPFD